MEDVEVNGCSGNGETDPGINRIHKSMSSIGSSVSHQWETESLYHEWDCLDFTMWVTLYHQPHAAYFTVVGTCHHGHPPINAGTVGIEVPNPDRQDHLSVDRVWVSSVERLIPGFAEKYRFGVSAGNIQKIVTYLTLLKQYLDEHPTPPQLTRKPL